MTESFRPYPWKSSEEPKQYSPVAAVEPLGGLRLQIQFENGVTKIYECDRLLDDDRFAKLREVEFFRTVRVDPESRGIRWDDELKVAGSKLWRHSSEPRITTEEMEKALHEIFGNPLLREGFVRTRKYQWVRSRSPEIRDVFHITNIRHSFNPAWGFSLDYCPTVGKGCLKWHRTEKSAQMDVVHDPIDYTDTRSNEREFRSWLIPKYLSPRVVTEETAKGVAQKAIPQALAWFAQVETIADVKRLLEKKKSEVPGRDTYRLGFGNYLQQPLALALTNARLGHSEVATKQMKELVQYEYYQAGSAELLTLVSKYLGA